MMPTKPKKAAKPAKPADKPRGRGRPAYERNEKDLGQVVALITFGFGVERIAEYLKMDKAVLRRAYSHEIEHSRTQLAGVAMTKVVKALNDDQEWAIKFVMSSLGRNYGWGPDAGDTGKTVQEMLGGFDPARLAPAKFAQLMDLLVLAGANIDPSLLPAPQGIAA